MKKSFTLSKIKAEQFIKVAHHFSEKTGTFFLYSGTSLDCAQNSFLALFPFETLIVEENFYTLYRGKEVIEKKAENPWTALNHWEQTTVKQEADQLAFGWISYEMGYFVDFDQNFTPFKTKLPLSYWQRHAIVVTFQVATCQLTVEINCSALSYLTKEEQTEVNLLCDPSIWDSFLNSSLPKTSCFFEEITQPNRLSQYMEGVQVIQEQIRAGEVYQVNLAQTFCYQGTAQLFPLFSHLNQLNPAPFSAYIKGEKWTIVSFSPERFLKKEGDYLETRPIKGTIKRGETVEKDLINKQHLCSSLKEQAELLMITDLMRNDLGKISQTGSVKVKELKRCEAYKNVFHLVSIISSYALPSLTPFEIIRSCFPGGSITGCPKWCAKKMIHQLERQSRGIYTGSIGYLTGKGDFDLNIAIRTLVQFPDQFELKLGSGIVIDSDAFEEYLETLAKGASFFQTLNSSKNSLSDD